MKRIRRPWSPIPPSEAKQREREASTGHHERGGTTRTDGAPPRYQMVYTAMTGDSEHTVRARGRTGTWPRESAARQSTRGAAPAAPALVALPCLCTRPPKAGKNRAQCKSNEQRKAGSKNSTKSNSNQQDSNPNFTQLKFSLARTYPQEIIA